MRRPTTALEVARGAFVVVLVAAMVVFAWGLPGLWSEAVTFGARPDDFLAHGHYHLSGREEDALERIGLGRGWHGALVLGRHMLLFLSAAAIAALLWLRSRSWSALYVAWFLVGSQLFLSFDVTTQDAPGWVRYAGGALAVTGWLSVVAFILVFPDGRWAPAVFAVAAAVVGALAFIEVADIGGVSGVLWPLGVALSCCALLTGLVRQVILAARVQSLARWILVGLAVGGTFLFLTLWFQAEQLAGFGQPRTGLDTLARRITVETALMLTPMVFGLGVVYLVIRTGFWDLDLGLNRAVVYSSLTGWLLGVYFVSVIVVQAIVNDLFDVKGHTLAVVFSTGLIAVIALPARERVQQAIDRLFFRRRFDLERTVESFEARLRDRDRLELVETDLLAATMDAFEPARAALWIPDTRTSEARR